MNLRRSALASLLLISAPLLGGICPALSEHLGPREALAQQDQVTKLAREKFKEGVTAYQGGRFDEARALFLQAYALKRHPAVLLNLGQSELKSGYVEDAGNHLQQFLREHKTATDQQKGDAKVGIAEARKRTGQAIMIVDADGADVAIDGKAIGKTPLLDPWFVKPGPHEASAAHSGKTGTSKFTAERGKAMPVTITLGTSGGAVVAPIPTPAPTPAPPAQPGIAPAPYPPAGPLGPQPMPTGPGPGASYGGDTGTSGGREDFVDWFVDTPVAWVGAGLTGVGVIGAIVGGAIGGSAASSANDTTDQINAEIANPTQPGGQLSSGQTPCGPQDSNGSQDIPYYAGACEQLRSDLSTRDAGYTAMGVFLGVGVVAAAGTVIYYFVDADSESDSMAEFQVIPLVSQDTQGLGILGTF